ncbi:MAG: hypothetical protein CL908_05685 [Deltaproteobacteria bacterium]|jgi:hypothetical protein|nr:hypothetical protein [Deltaproteobacteria bacterium]
MATVRKQIWNRIVTGVGSVCVVATLLLSSTGVRSVRAEGEDHALMSVDPALEVAPVPAAPSTPTAAGPRPGRVATVDDAENVERPGISGIEVEPGVIVLNTRGYNYGPPPQELQPEALRHESDAP